MSAITQGAESTIDNSTLNRLLPDTDADTFFAEHWDRSPVHMTAREAGAGGFANLVSARDIDHLFGYSDARIRVARWHDGSVQNRSIPRIGGMPNIYELYRAWNDGFSISIDHLHRFWPPVTRFYKQIESTLQHPAGVNLYYTPPGSQAFRIHYDGHDVFVLQTAGTKDWNVYRQIDPFPNTGRELDQDEEGEPLLSCTLREGDVLYIPRGFAHAARATDSASIHLTVQVTPLTWYELLRIMEGDADWMDLRLRQALPPGMMRQKETLHQTLSALLGRPIAEQAVQDTLQRYCDRLWGQAQPIPDGHFESLQRVNRISLDSRLQKRVHACCRTESTAEGARLVFHSRSVTTPANMLEALRFVASATEFSVAEVPALADPVKLQLCTLLVREGLLSLE